jgi:hypothetical protein
MNSTDKMISEVIDGFERRSMFTERVKLEGNDLNLVARHFMTHLVPEDHFISYIESDVIVENGSPCWLEQMVSIMQANSNIAMLGSSIDKDDFVDPEQVRHLRLDADDARWRARLKCDSPERLQVPQPDHHGDTFKPHNPAGRMLVLRTSAIREVGIAEDAALSAKLEAAGYETAIATRVRHRHLSLLHIYDYPTYDIAERDSFMGKIESPN